MGHSRFSIIRHPVYEKMHAYQVMQNCCKNFNNHSRHETIICFEDSSADVQQN